MTTSVDFDPSQAIAGLSAIERTVSQLKGTVTELSRAFDVLQASTPGKMTAELAGMGVAVRGVMNSMVQNVRVIGQAFEKIGTEGTKKLGQNLKKGFTDAGAEAEQGAVSMSKLLRQRMQGQYDQLLSDQHRFSLESLREWKNLGANMAPQHRKMLADAAAFTGQLLAIYAAAEARVPNPAALRSTVGKSPIIARGQAPELRAARADGAGDTDSRAFARPTVRKAVENLISDLVSDGERVKAAYAKAYAATAEGSAAVLANYRSYYAGLEQVDATRARISANREALLNAEAVQKEKERALLASPVGSAAVLANYREYYAGLEQADATRARILANREVLLNTEATQRVRERALLASPVGSAAVLANYREYYEGLQRVDAMRARIAANREVLLNTEATQQARERALLATDVVSKAKLAEYKTYYEGIETVDAQRARILANREVLLNTEATQAARERARLGSDQGSQAALAQTRALYLAAGAVSSYASSSFDPAPVAAAASVKALGAANLESAEAAKVHRARLAELTHGMSSAHSAARGLASGFGAMWLTWGQIAPLLIGASLSHAFVRAVKDGAEFENTLITIQNLGEIAATDMARLSDESLRLGSTTQFGPNEVAKGLKALALAGLDASQQLQAIKPALDFATVGELPLEKAAESLVAISTAFGYSAAGFSAVSDVIAKTAAVSMSTVSDMTEAFRVASSVAQQFGVSLTDFSTMLGLLSQLGIRGSAAGTAVRNMYNELLGGSKEARRVLKDVLNVDIIDNFTKKVKPLATIFKDLGNALAPYDFKRQMEILRELGNERGTKALSAGLTAAVTEAQKAGKSVTTVLKDLQEKLADAPGFVALAAAGMALSVQNQLKAVGNALDSTLIKAFNEASPAIQEFSLAMRNAFNSDEFVSAVKSMVTAVAELGAFLTRHLGIIAAVAAGLAIGVTALVAMQVAVHAATIVLPVLGAALGAVGLGAGAAAVGVRGLMGALGPIGWALLAVSAAWAVFGNKGASASEQAAAAEKIRSAASIQGLKDEEQRLDVNIERLREGTNGVILAAAVEHQILLAGIELSNQRALAADNEAISKLKAARAGIEAAVLPDTGPEFFGAQAEQASLSLQKIDREIEQAHNRADGAARKRLQERVDAENLIGRIVVKAREHATLAQADADRRRKRPTGPLSEIPEDDKGKAAKDRESAIKHAKLYIRSLQDETEQVGLSNDQVKMLAAAREAAKAPTEELRKEIMKGALALSIAVKAEKDYNEAHKVRSAQDKNAADLLNQRIDDEEKAEAARENARQQSIKTLKDLQYARIAAAEGAIPAMLEGSKSLKEEIELLGLDAKQQHAVTQARQAAVIATKEATLALLEHSSAISGTQTRIEIALKEEIRLMKEKLGLENTKFDRNVAVEEAKKASDEWTKFYDSIYNGLTDSLYRAFESGKGFFKTLWDGIKNTFKTTVLKLVVQGVMGTVGLGGGVGAAAQGVGGIASSVSGLSSLYSAATSTFSLGSEVLAGTLSMTNALGTLAANATGTGISGLLATNGAFGTAAAGTASAAAGGVTSALAAIGPIGWAAAAVAAIFAFGGRGKKTETDTGIAGTLNADGPSSVQATADWKQKGGWFSSDRTGRNFSPISGELQKTLDTATFAITQATKGYASAIGQSATAVDGYTHAIDVSLKGLDATKQQEVIAKALAGFGEGMAERVLGAWTTTLDTTITEMVTQFEGSYGPEGSGGLATSEVTRTVKGTSTYKPSEFAKEGETAVQTLTRLATSLTAVNSSFALMGNSLLDVSLAGANVASSLVDALGGMEKFSSTFTAYYEHYYDAEEKRANVVKAITAELKKAGAELSEADVAGATSAQFRAFTEQVLKDLGSASPLYRTLIGVSGAFAGITPSVEEAKQAARSATDALDSTTGALESAADAAERAATALDGIASASSGIVSAARSLVDYGASLQAQAQDLKRQAVAEAATAEASFRAEAKRIQQAKIDADKDVQSATESLSKAQTDYADALKNAVSQAAKRAADALSSLTSAIEGVSQVIRAQAESVTQARDKVQSAQDAITSAYLSAQDRVQGLQKAASSALSSASSSIQEFLDKLAGSTKTLKGNTGVGFQRASLSDLAAKARAGDAKAAADLPGAAQTLLEAAKEQSQTLAQYAAEEVAVRQLLAGVKATIPADAAPVDEMAAAVAELDRLSAIVAATGASTTARQVDLMGAYTTALAGLTEAQSTYDSMLARAQAAGIAVDLVGVNDKLKPALDTLKDAQKEYAEAQEGVGSASSTVANALKAVTDAQAVLATAVTNQATATTAWNEALTLAASLNLDISTVSTGVLQSLGEALVQARAVVQEMAATKLAPDLTLSEKYAALTLELEAFATRTRDLDLGGFNVHVDTLGGLLIKYSTALTSLGTATGSTASTVSGAGGTVAGAQTYTLQQGVTALAQAVGAGSTPSAILSAASTNLGVSAGGVVQVAAAGGISGFDSSAVAQASAVKNLRGFGSSLYSIDDVYKLIQGMLAQGADSDLVYGNLRTSYGLDSTAVNTAATFKGLSGFSGSPSSTPIRGAGGTLIDAMSIEIADIVEAIQFLQGKNKSVAEIRAIALSDYGVNAADVKRAADSAGIPGFARGTNRVPQDMLAQIHKDEVIIPAAFNPERYNAASGNTALVIEIKALREEVRQLRADNSAENTAIAAATGKTAKLMDRAMPDGDAIATRVAT